MSLETILNSFVTTVATDIKALRAGQGTLASLTTTVKTSLVAAINELVTNQGALASLSTTDKASIVAAINEAISNQGALASLNTTAKTSLVAAINEVLAASGGGVTIDDVTPSLTTVYSSTKTANEISAAIAALVDSAPGTIDTLNELAAALGDDPNFATTVTTALGQRVAVTAQTFTGGEQTQARTNIGAAAATDLSTLQTSLGNVEADIVTLYTTTRDT